MMVKSSIHLKNLLSSLSSLDCSWNCHVHTENLHKQGCTFWIGSYNQVIQRWTSICQYPNAAHKNTSGATKGKPIEAQLVIENFLSEEQISAAQDEMERIVNNMNPADHAVTVFETEDENRHTKDQYFLNSSDKIRFFYEEGALDKEGELSVGKTVAFNKVGHALHVLNPVFKTISFSQKVQKLVEAVGYKDPAIVQSMYIFKQPKIGGSVTPHFDATFLYVEPIEHLLGLWFPLEDATLENGCLWFIPGSHKTHKAEYRFVRTHKTDAAMLEFVGSKPDFHSSQFIPVPVKKGSCVLIHGLVIHKSEANTSEKSRHAYALHIVETRNTTWSPDNWLQPTETHQFPHLYAQA